MRRPLIALSLLLGLAAPTGAQLSIGISSPGISIGINLPLFPELQRVPGYPVYYAPGVASNYFFYDGLYWVYENDTWYASDWYNGPWRLVGPQAVPLFLLRVPVRYYRSPPTYFRGWRADAPPRWGEHWGNDWQQQRPGWDRWNRNSAPAPAPLPTYQRQYSRERYPQVEQQQALRQQNYRYQPRDAEVRQHAQPPALMNPLPVPSRAEQPNRPAPQQHEQRPAPDRPQEQAPRATQPAPPVQHANPAPRAEQPDRPAAQPREQRPAPNRTQEQAPRAAPPAREQAPAAARPKEAPRENRPAQNEQQPPPGQGKDREPGDERGREPKK
jgi:hypothetical protein